MSERSIIETWERLVRFHRATTAAMDRRLRAEFGRSLDDYDVLHQVNAHGAPMRMGELAKRLLVANSSCNRIVNRLVDDGLLERSHGTADRREVLVEMTRVGRRQWRRMAAVHTRDIERLVGAPLTERQRTELDHVLSILSKPVESIEPE